MSLPTQVKLPQLSHLLQFLGLDLHLLLQGCVGLPQLHGLLIPQQHLLLHLPLTAFLRPRGGCSELRWELTTPQTP